MSLSLNQTLLTFYSMCETNFDNSIDSGCFCKKGYLPLIQKGSVTFTCSLTVYVKDGLLFAQDLSLENSAGSYVFDWLNLFQSLLVFPPSITIFAFMHGF